MSTAANRPTRMTLAAFAAPCFPLGALYLPLNVYAPAFYTNAIGLNLGVVGLVFMSARLANIAFDPFIGGIMDRTHTRWGRFKPWLAVSVPMIMIGVSQLFFAKRGVDTVYLVVWLSVVYAGFSIATLAQLSIGGSLSGQYHERSRVFSWWQGANAISMMIAMLIVVVWKKLEPGSEVVPMMAWWVLAVSIPAFGLTLFGIEETAVTAGTHRNGVKEYFILLRRRAVRLIVLADLMMGVAAGVSAAVGVFFITSTKHLDKGALALALTFFLAAGTLTNPVWAYAARKLEKHRAWVVAVSVHCFAMGLILFSPPGNIVFLCLSYSVWGMTWGGNYMLPRAMMADAGDEERLETGADRTGLLYAWVTSVYKIGQAVSIGVVFLALQLVHFNPAAGATNHPLALAALPTLYCIIPAMLCVAAALILWRYPLTAARHAEIRAQLLQKEAIAGSRTLPAAQNDLATTAQR